MVQGTKETHQEDGHKCGGLREERPEPVPAAKTADHRQPKEEIMHPRHDVRVHEAQTAAPSDERERNTGKERLKVEDVWVVGVLRDKLLILEPARCSAYPRGRAGNAGASPTRVDGSDGRGGRGGRGYNPYMIVVQRQ